MKRTGWVALEALGLALVAVIGLYAFGVVGPASSSGTSAVDSEAIAAAEEESEEEEGGAGPGAPDEWFVAQRAGPGGQLEAQDFVRATDQARAVRGEARIAGFGQSWELTGPTNVGGRIVDLAVDPTEPNTIYVAAATGGVWKNTDGLFTMEKTWPDDFAQAMGALGAASDGTLWAGTGEPNNGGGSLVFGGNGVYRSTDGGERWKNRGLKQSGTIGRIVVHPTDPDIVYVAAAGSLFNPGGDRGIYRSTNGGNSWKLVLAPENGFSGGIDLAIDPSNPDRIFAAMWQRRREPDLRTYGGVGSGLWRSDDGGDTWERLENVTSLSPGDETGLTRSDTLGRIGVALAPSNPNRVYVITTATFGQDKGFYVSNDGGDSFQAQTPPRLAGRLRLVVRADLGRPGQRRPPVRGRREPAPLRRRRRDVGELGRRSRRPARDGLEPARRQPHLPRERRRDVRLGHERVERLLAPGGLRAVHAVLLGGRGRAVPRTAHRRLAGQRLPALVGLPDEPGRSGQLELVRVR